MEQPELRRTGGAEQPDAPVRAARARDDPDPDLGQAEGSRLLGDADVGGEREAVGDARPCLAANRSSTSPVSWYEAAIEARVASRSW